MKMKAIVSDRYGSPDVMKLEEVQKPVPSDREVLVKIYAASVNAGDWHYQRADPFFMRLIGFGFLKPKNRILGSDIAGRVEAVGSEVERFKPGDEVFGDLSESGYGAFAEFATVPEMMLMHKPSNLTFEDAAALPLASITALQGLRDKGGIEEGQKVLVNGASGGVGTFAVQIAKSFDAEVTAVCSTRNVDMVRSLGADHVIDYTQEDVTKNGEKYDLIIDAAAFRSITDYRNSLAEDGTYVLVGGSTSRFLQAMFQGLVPSKGGNFGTMVAKPNSKDLAVIKELAETEKLTPVIDRRYTLNEVPKAVGYVEEGHARGKVVITV